MTPGYLRHRAGLIEAMDQRLFTPEWLDSQVESGAYTLFENDEAAILARIIAVPTGVVLVEGAYATGTAKGIQELKQEVEAWGAAHGAAFATLSSRRAWARLFPDYHEYKVTLMKDLGNG